MNKNPKYIAAKKTGKIVNFVTYLANEKADKNANYFLVEILDNSKSFNLSNLEEIAIKSSWGTFFEFEKHNLTNLPFYCFNQQNVQSIEELNFNNLKKCDTNSVSDKFLVISAADKTNVNNKKFDEWHQNQPTIDLEIKKNGCSTIKKIQVKVIKIFHKQYQPTINN